MYIKTVTTPIFVYLSISVFNMDDRQTLQTHRVMQDLSFGIDRILKKDTKSGKYVYIIRTLSRIFTDLGRGGLDGPFPGSLKLLLLIR